jgi:hypothetical protein
LVFEQNGRTKLLLVTHSLLLDLAKVLLCRKTSITKDGLSSNIVRGMGAKKDGQTMNIVHGTVATNTGLPCKFVGLFVICKHFGSQLGWKETRAYCVDRDAMFTPFFRHGASELGHAAYLEKTSIEQS